MSKSLTAYIQEGSKTLLSEKANNPKNPENQIIEQCVRSVIDFVKRYGPTTYDEIKSDIHLYITEVLRKDSDELEIKDVKGCVTYLLEKYVGREVDLNMIQSLVIAYSKKNIK